jgi:hypothetical protein
MEKWVAWFKELGASGHIKEPGHPLEAFGMVVKRQQKIVNDGPFAESKDVVGGYIVVAAKDLAEATERDAAVIQSEFRSPVYPGSSGREQPDVARRNTCSR